MSSVYTYIIIVPLGYIDVLLDFIVLVEIPWSIFKKGLSRDNPKKIKYIATYITMAKRKNTAIGWLQLNCVEHLVLPCWQQLSIKEMFIRTHWCRINREGCHFHIQVLNGKCTMENWRHLTCHKFQPSVSESKSVFDEDIPLSVVWNGIDGINIISELLIIQWNYIIYIAERDI